jgi:uncharacterized coiled-coil DUF342 family protein
MTVIKKNYRYYADFFEGIRSSENIGARANFLEEVGDLVEDRDQLIKEVKEEKRTSTWWRNFASSIEQEVSELRWRLQRSCMDTEWYRRGYEELYGANQLLRQENMRLYMELEALKNPK